MLESGRDGDADAARDGVKRKRKKRRERADQLGVGGIHISSRSWLMSGYFVVSRSRPNPASRSPLSPCCSKK